VWPMRGRGGSRRIGHLLVTVVLGVGCSALKPPASNPELAQSPVGVQVPCAEPDRPIEVADLAPLQGLARGGLAKVRAGFVVAGLETTETGWNIVPGGDGELGIPRIWSTDGSPLPMPGDSVAIARTGILNPVALDAERWAVVWGESVPQSHWLGTIPAHHAITHLWASEWSGEGWASPTLLAQAENVRWGTSHTVRHHPELGTHVMVTANHILPTGGAAALLFGSPEGELTPIPLGGYARPLMGSFDISSSGEIVAVAMARDDGLAATPLDVLYLTSEDGGVTWSEVTILRIVPTDHFLPSALQVRVLGNGETHVLWKEHGDRSLSGWGVRHLVRPEHMSNWSAQTIPLQEESGGTVIGWDVGPDHCGRLTLAYSRLDHETTWMEARQWVGGHWTDPQPLLSEFFISSHFEGQGWDGSWHLVLSGDHRTQWLERFAESRAAGAAPPPLRVWVHSP